MKKRWLFIVLMSSVLVRASAGIYVYTGAPYDIPDGNPVGVWSSVNVSGATAPASHVAVTLNVSGGYNGDLYAYLSYAGRMVPLLNRTGVSSGNPLGSSGAGMSVTLSDTAAANIHAAWNGYLSGSYRPDGQDINPLSSQASFSANGGAITLDGTFGDFDPNGVWTLFFADVVSSGDISTLNSWNILITGVPEPDVAAMAVALAIVRACWSRRKSG
jgi:hypothetical protein